MSIVPEKTICGESRPTAVAKAAPTILLVEDDASVRTLLTRLLTMHGFKALVAENGVASLPIWAAHKNDISLLLTDVVMPGGLSGREIADRFQRDQPTLKVVFTSGYSRDLLNSDALLEAGTHFVQKPYRPDQLLAAIRAALAGNTPSI